MIFQTYVYIDGKWRKFDPYPVCAAEAQEVVQEVKIHMKYWAHPKYAYVCAMPVGWSFA